MKLSFQRTEQSSKFGALLHRRNWGKRKLLLQKQLSALDSSPPKENRKLQLRTPLVSPSVHVVGHLVRVSRPWTIGGQGLGPVFKSLPGWASCLAQTPRANSSQHLSVLRFPLICSGFCLQGLSLLFSCLSVDEPPKLDEHLGKNANECLSGGAKHTSNRMLTVLTLMYSFKNTKEEKKKVLLPLTS